MSREAIVRSQPSQKKRRRRVGEVAGGAAADCTAVCCCCPCALLNCLVLAVYTVPARLFKKMARRRRRRMLKNNAGSKKSEVVSLRPHRSSDVGDNDIAPVDPTRMEEHFAADKAEAVALENEMWARFAGTGFWRSESQREP